MIRRIGIDLGTSNIRVYVPGRGVIIDEPCVAALDATGQHVLAVGTDAKSMLGRTPEAIIAAKPLTGGVIASYRVMKQILQIMMHKVFGRLRLLKPEIIVNVPVGATSTEKRAVLDGVEAVGAKRVLLVKSPIAAALGAMVDISSSTGNMIIDVGGGKTEVAVIALGDIVASSSVRYGGEKFDEAIIDYIRKKHNLLIGEQTAEQVKIEVGCALNVKKELKMEVSGSNTITGLPESIIVHTGDVVNAIKPVLNEIILAVKQVLQKTPPELSSDVMDKGMVIAGGGAQLRNFEDLMTKVTGVPCQMAEEPDICTIKGIGIVVDNPEQFMGSMIWKTK
jgi:rod shape-determining protein MreB